MNLIVDVGNTSVKIAVFQDDKLLEKTTAKPEDTVLKVKAFQKKYSDLKSAMVSSVGNLSIESIEFLNKQFKLVQLSSRLKLPFANRYATPKTLGPDRLALAAGAVAQFPKKNTLVIDAGTCITYDFITAKNHYLGGAISPGVAMRYKALNHFTEGLPLLKAKKPESVIGASTAEAIHSGVVNGILTEIDGLIDTYKQNYPDLTVILTGGDAKFLSKQLKSGIFANSHFLLEGLNFILRHNIS